MHDQMIACFLQQLFADELLIVNQEDRLSCIEFPSAQKGSFGRKSLPLLVIKVSNLVYRALYAGHRHQSAVARVDVNFVLFSLFSFRTLPEPRFSVEVFEVEYRVSCCQRHRHSLNLIR